MLDEPTGNLDQENSKIVFELLRKFSATKTIIVVTHDLKSAYNYADFVILLNSGKVISTFSLTQNSFVVDFSKNDIDALLPLIDVIKYKASDKELKLHVWTETSKKEYTINSNTILGVFNNIYNDYKNEKIQVVIDDSTSNVANSSQLGNTNQSNSIFPFKFVRKYSVVLFKNKMWRNIFSIVLLVLNIIMIFIYTNIASFDYIGATKNAVNENDAYYA